MNDRQSGLPVSMCKCGHPISRHPWISSSDPLGRNPCEDCDCCDADYADDPESNLQVRTGEWTCKFCGGRVQCGADNPEVVNKAGVDRPCDACPESNPPEVPCEHCGAPMVEGGNDLDWECGASAMYVNGAGFVSTAADTCPNRGRKSPLPVEYREPDWLLTCIQFAEAAHAWWMKHGDGGDPQMFGFGVNTLEEAASCGRAQYDELRGLA